MWSNSGFFHKRFPHCHFLLLLLRCCWFGYTIDFHSNYGQRSARGDFLEQFLRISPLLLWLLLAVAPLLCLHVANFWLEGRPEGA